MNIQTKEAVLASRTTDAIMSHPRFVELTTSRSKLGWTLATIMWIVYFGFILLVAFNKDDGHILSTKISQGSTTSLAIVGGFAILVFTFLITALYVMVANTRFDRITSELHEEFDR